MRELCGSLHVSRAFQLEEQLMTIIDAQVCAILQRMAQTCADAQVEQAYVRKMVFNSKVRVVSDKCPTTRRIN
jgi:hypothetical protein